MSYWDCTCCRRRTNVTKADDDDTGLEAPPQVIVQRSFQELRPNIQLPRPTTPTVGAAASPTGPLSTGRSSGSPSPVSPAPSGGALSMPGAAHAFAFPSARRLEPMGTDNAPLPPGSVLSADCSGRTFTFEPPIGARVLNQLVDGKNSLWSAPEPERIERAKALAMSLWGEIMAQNIDIDKVCPDLQIRKFFVLCGRVAENFGVQFPIEGWQLRQLIRSCIDIKIIAVPAPQLQPAAATASPSASAGTYIPQLAPLKLRGRQRLSPIPSPSTSPVRAPMLSAAGEIPLLQISPSEPQFHHPSFFPEAVHEAIADFAPEYMSSFVEELCAAVVSGEKEVDSYSRFYRRVLIHSKGVNAQYKIVTESALHTLRLSATMLTVSDFLGLEAHINLQEITITGTHWFKPDVISLLAQLPRLRIVELQVSGLKDADIVALKQLRGLTQVNLTGAGSLTPAIIPMLAELPQLERIVLDVAPLSYSPHFTELLGTSWSESALRAFSCLQKHPKFQSIKCGDIVWRPVSTANTLNPDAAAAPPRALKADRRHYIYSRENSRAGASGAAEVLTISLPGGYENGSQNSRESSKRSTHHVLNITPSSRRNNRGGGGGDSSSQSTPSASAVQSTT